MNEPELAPPPAAATTNPIDADIASIEDEGARHRIAAAFERLRDQAEYGLVFEKHRPESVVLHGHSIVEDGYSTLRNTPSPRHSFRVLGIDADTARLVPVDEQFRPSGDETEAPLVDLVPIVKFGTPIFPGLMPTGEVLRGGDKPFHTVINGENFHALETLLYAYEGQVDCIYLDPPYNTGAKDWKYNNDYVEGDDRYRHSKWLSFIDKRLRLAKRLLNPDCSTLIITIDEKEYLRLGLVIEDVFKGERIQMVSTLINPASVARAGGFGRSDEYIFFVMVGGSAPQRVPLSREWVSAKGRTHTGSVRWDLLRRSGPGASRKDSPGCFYPIYVDPDGSRLAGVGESLPVGTSNPEQIEGLVAVLPIRKDGSEGRWQWTPTTIRSRIDQGRVRITGSAKKGFVVSILKDGEYAKVLNGEFAVIGSAADGSILVADGDAETVLAVPSSQWRISSHDATQYGSRLLGESFLPGRKFPFPKSLYAVEDALRFFVSGKSDALVIDFFAGSGTTAHAVMRLNKQDEGRRRSIMVTNNEVSAEEQKALRSKGFFPGDTDWEQLGICEHITKPRIAAAISGLTPDHEPVKGDYKFTDEFPMADGFEENARFFDLVYLDPDVVEAKEAFGQIAHLLWLMAGAEGSVIQKEHRSGWSVPNDAVYGILFRNKGRAGMADELKRRETAGRVLRHIFIVADSADEFIRSAEELGIDPERSTRLYRDYLKNFRTNVTDTQGAAQ
jgi:adenine-specific DNA-methyltransferase